MKSEIKRMLSDKQNTYHCLNADTADTAFPEKQTVIKTLYQQNYQKPPIVGLTRMYEIKRQNMLLKMEVH